MSRLPGPLSPKFESGLLVVGAVVLGVLLLGALCALGLVFLAWLGPSVSVTHSNIILDI